MHVEKPDPSRSGWAILAVELGLILASLACFLIQPALVGLFGLLIAFLATGFFIIDPNQAKVIQLFGTYVGTAKTAGLRWMLPFYSRRTISLRLRNFESTKLKVNDRDGAPIEIATIVAWRVVNTYDALFQVQMYEEYVLVQTESALRNLAMSYPYDAHDATQISLHGSPDKVVEHLQKELLERLAKAGVEVVEARLSHLAYAPEIAASMLQRQQAGAIIGARQKLVEGAVGMVELALSRLVERKIVQFDEKQKATLVSNLLVVLCSERSTQPVVNTGSNQS